MIAFRLFYTGNITTANHLLFNNLIVFLYRNKGKIPNNRNSHNI